MLETADADFAETDPAEAVAWGDPCACVSTWPHIAQTGSNIGDSRTCRLLSSEYGVDPAVGGASRSQTPMSLLDQFQCYQDRYWSMHWHHAFASDELTFAPDLTM